MNKEAKTESSKELELGRSALLPERGSIPDEYKWRLYDIFADQEEWEKTFSALKARLPEMAAFKGTLSESPARMKELFALRDELAVTLEKLFVYANMKNHEDTSDSKRQGPANRISALSMEFSAAASFITPESLSMPKERLEEFSKAPELAEYSFCLRELLRRQSHVLSEAEEFILARSSDAAGCADNIFSMLTNADMKFPAIKDEKGVNIEMSEERAVSYLRSRRRSVRKAAFESLYTPYNAMKNTLGATFDGMLKSA